MSRPPRNSSKTSPETAAAKVRAAQAMELRLAGKTFDEIAQIVGYAGKQGAYDAVKRSLDAIIREPAEELRKADLERLDRLWTTPYQQAQTGDMHAVATCLKLMERRAKLLGLDAPQKVAETDPEGKAVGPRLIELIAPSAKGKPRNTA